MSKPLPHAAAPVEVLSGLIERVTFHSLETGFCVLRVKARGHRDLVTVVGHAAIISAGEWVTASGEWVNDATHGLQLRARFLKTSEPTSREGIERYLGSGLIRGIGPVYAKRLVALFGTDVFDVIEASPQRLREVGASWCWWVGPRPCATRQNGILGPSSGSGRARDRKGPRRAASGARTMHDVQSGASSRSVADGGLKLKPFIAPTLSLSRQVGPCEVVAFVEQRRAQALGAGISEAVAHVQTGHMPDELAIRGCSLERSRSDHGREGQVPGSHLAQELVEKRGCDLEVLQACLLSTHAFGSAYRQRSCRLEANER